ncbi:MAG TPA: NAD(P)-dependent oxidoreductase [Rhodospirillaceae bacterium]|nr:SDR family oxidoreductase [Alphaproteobacteria bacterium]HBH25880.1 NAD(P)-dependent oxidoreductase [Rhodospirillaceae bacterium]
MSKAQRKFFCFGYGYTAQRLGRALAREGGWTLAGTTRAPERKEALGYEDVKAHIFDHAYPLPDVGKMLAGTTHLLLSVPPDVDGSLVARAHGEEIAALPGLSWVGYLSTTGVYGDRGGGWVDEDSAANPTTIRGTRRAMAERQWYALHRSHGLPLHIFRLAGIYGPQRSALDAVRAGMSRRIDKPGHAFSRIHVDDVVQVIRASMAAPAPGRVYNLADDCPAPSHAVIAYACDLLGLSVPPLLPFSEADLAPITRSFYADNKRVHNDRIKRELGVRLLYPSFREGLAACLAEEGGAAS